MGIAHYRLISQWWRYWRIGWPPANSIPLRSVELINYAFGLMKTSKQIMVIPTAPVPTSQNRRGIAQLQNKVLVTYNPTNTIGWLLTSCHRVEQWDCLVKGK